MQSIIKKGHGKGKKNQAFQLSIHEGKRCPFSLFSFVKNIHFYDYNQYNKT